jgi:L-asparaginase
MVEEFTKKLKEIKFENHDGIVLTHGSDTLGDTANYLAMTLPGIKVPMILVSSHFPITDARANGVKNLKGALDFISHVKLPGVYVTYHSKGETKVIYGSRVLQCDNITDEFMSISADKKGEKTICPLGVIKENGKFEVLDPKLFENLDKRRQVERPNLLDGIESLDARIEVIRPWLGVDYDTVNLARSDAVLHQSYHSGTARTSGRSHENLLAFAKRCQDNRVDLYLHMYGEAGRDVYSSTAKYCDSGGLTLMNLSEVAARMKLLIAYSRYRHDKEKRENFIFQPVNEEFIGPDTRLERGSPSSGVKPEERPESSSS